MFKPCLDENIIRKYSTFKIWTIKISFKGAKRKFGLKSFINEVSCDGKTDVTWDFYDEEKDIYFSIWNYKNWSYIDASLESIKEFSFFVSHKNWIKKIKKQFWVELEVENYSLKTLKYDSFFHFIKENFFINPSGPFLESNIESPSLIEKKEIFMDLGNLYYPNKKEWKKQIENIIKICFKDWKVLNKNWKSVKTKLLNSLFLI